MLIDLHSHTSGISICCLKDAEGILRDTKATGIDGIVLTNHYQSYYVKNGVAAEFAEKYVKEYYHTKEVGEKLGIKVFWGLEVTMDFCSTAHLLVYGVGTEILEKHPALYSYSQKELYEVVKSYGGVLVQGHPFRNGSTVLNTDYLDGVEISCHPIYLKSYAEELTDIARSNGLALTCGGDYHADTYRPKCGMYVPDDITDEKALGEYILSSKKVKLCIEDIDTREIYDLEYNR